MTNKDPNAVIERVERILNYEGTTFSSDNTFVGPWNGGVIESFDLRELLRLARIGVSLEGEGEPNGDAGDALDWALGHLAAPQKQLGFLDDWRDGRDLDTRWPGYMRWLGVQREGARKARALKAIGGGSGYET